MIDLNKYEETTYGELRSGDVFRFVNGGLSSRTLQIKISHKKRVYLKNLDENLSFEGSLISDEECSRDSEPVLFYGRAADIIQVKKIPDAPDVELIDHFVRHFIEAYENDATPQELWDLVHQRDALITGEVVP